VFRDEKYLRDAVECGELIWQRGLLRKGYGLCHGSAGNGYALLSLYHATQDKKHLHRACIIYGNEARSASVHLGSSSWSSVMSVCF